MYVRGGSCAYPNMVSSENTQDTLFFSVLLYSSLYSPPISEKAREMETELSAKQQGHSSHKRHVKRELETGSQKEERTRLLDEWKRLRHIHKEKTKDEQTGSGVKTSGLEPTSIFPFSSKRDVMKFGKTNLI